MKLKSPPSYGTAFGLPIADAISAIQASAESLRLAAEKVPGRSQGFGQRIALAVKRKVGAGYSRIQASAQASNEGGFGEKVTKNVKKKLSEKCRKTRTPKQAKEKAEKDSEAWEAAKQRRNTPRPPTKSG